jgi:hypothetical protein
MAMAKEPVQNDETFVINGHSFVNQQAYINAGHRCGVRQMSPDRMIDIEMETRAILADIGYHRMNDRANKNVFAGPLEALTGGCPGFSPTNISIPIAYHVITNGSQGNVTMTQLNDQTTVLNNAFAGTGFCLFIEKFSCPLIKVRKKSVVECAYL